MVPGVLLKPALEAEEEDGPGGDVEEEGEADAEGGEEHWADGVAAPEGTKLETVGDNQTILSWFLKVFLNVLLLYLDVNIINSLVLSTRSMEAATTTHILWQYSFWGIQIWVRRTMSLQNLQFIVI